MDNKIKQIMEGVKNVVTPTPQTEAKAKQRTAICDSCKECKKFPNKRGVGSAICNQCGCDIFTKVRSPDASCPLNKW